MNTTIKNNKLIVTEEPVSVGYVYVYLLRHYMTSEIKTYISIREDSNTIEIDIPSDGNYLLHRLKIANSPIYYEDIEESSPEDEYDTSNIEPESIVIKRNIYYDGTNFYKDNKIVDVLSLLEDIEVEKNSVQYFFSSRLQECFKQHVDFKNCNRCGNNIDTYIRDLIMASLIVIDYLVDNKKYSEAEEIIERIGGCNGLCSSNISNDCGCN